ncbi:MAG: T9SS type A sorting domain-containing protein [Crocinitomicaceae bacterium]|nr:T9SS type A sorting domain-containing protein [Crocinitomicaceae bacterium]
MYKILPLIGSVAFSLGINAQSVQRQSIGTMGSTYQGEAISVQQSVGQPYQTNSYYSNEVESRPGFIQPSQFAVEFVQSTFQVELDVYPNPATAEVSFLTNENLEDLTIQVFDQTGKILLRMTLSDFETTN